MAIDYSQLRGITAREIVNALIRMVSICGVTVQGVIDVFATRTEDE